MKWIEAALREVEEELGELPADLEPVALDADDCGGWTYYTLTVETPRRFTA